MPLPRSVKIGAHRFAINDKLNEDGPLGRTKHTEQVIEIRPAQGASSLRDTLLHEVLHAVCDVAGLEYLMGIETSDEERLIRLLTPWVLGVIRDNPKLLAYLLEK